MTDPSPNSQTGSTVISPARGAEMRSFLQTRLRTTDRVPPLVHSWDFYHDRQALNPSKASPGNADSNTTSTNTATATAATGAYEQRLEHLARIEDVKQFWSVLNNFSVDGLALRDSVHLFHKGVKPVWEDARNARGGSWTFRVGKSHAALVWREICMLAIGERLQEAVEDPHRITFRDDICGISLSVRFNSVLVQVWNRDGDHADGIEAIKDVVLQSLPEDIRPRETGYYYKKHSEHAGFSPLN